MPRIIITAGAARGLEHCRRFLAKKNPHASKRAGQAIKNQFTLLQTNPEMGRPLTDQPEIRELVIEFGDSGYLALYHQNKKTDSVLILAFRHQKTAGYSK